jgi:hypothetical protein
MTNEKVDSFILQRETNDGHCEYNVEVSEMAHEYPDVEALWEDILPDYDIAVATEQSLLNYNRKSLLTKPIADTDKRRDNDIDNIKLITTAYLSSTDPEKAEYARQIIDRLNVLKGIKTKSYTKETADIKVLLNDLRVTFKNALPLLGLTDWVNTLEADNNAFIALFEQRNTEWSNRPKGNMRQSRGVTDGLYYKMIGTLNSEVTLNGDTKYHSFIDRLNTRIKYYKEHEYHPEHHDIIHSVAAPIPTQTYTGKAITPIPQVYYVEEGKETVELVFAVDFMVTYKENVNVGDAELLIHGKGKYTGKKTITFNIARV